MEHHQEHRVHRIPLLDFHLRSAPPRRLSWVELMEAGPWAWGRWVWSEQSLALAQYQLLSGLLSWGAGSAGVSWKDLKGGLLEGGSAWNALVERMVAALDASATSLTAPQEAFLQMPAGAVPAAVGVEGLCSPFTVLPGKDAKCFSVRRERLHALCPGCTTQALVRLNTNSACRLQYWSETPLAHGAIAWTAHFHDTADDEQGVWTALLNADLPPRGATPVPGWALDPASGQPYVATWVQALASGKPVDMGFPLLPLMRAARLGPLDTQETACDLCGAVGPVFRSFGMLPEPAALSSFGGHGKASKLFSRLVPKGRRHPWTLLVTRPAKGKRSEATFPQTLQSESDVRAQPGWVYLKEILLGMSHVDSSEGQDTGSPESMRRGYEFVGDVARSSSGHACRVVVNAYATKPVSSLNSNMKAFFNRSFDTTRLTQGSNGFSANPRAYGSVVDDLCQTIRDYREGWVRFVKDASRSSRQPLGEGGEAAKRPLATLASCGAKGNRKDRDYGNARALWDPLLLVAVHQAWDEAARLLGDCLEETESRESASLSLVEHLDAVGASLKKSLVARFSDPRDWARIEYAYKKYRTDKAEFHGVPRSAS